MTSTRIRNDDSRWHGALVKALKRQLRDELGAAFAAADHWARLKFLYAQIAAYADDATPLGQLKRFLYVMNALVTGQRHQCLKGAQVRQLAKLGSSILLAQGIKPRSSRLAYLHGELHSVLSQIHRQNGRQLAAAWEQGYASYVSKGRTGGEAGFEALSIANRALRLGHAKLALANFAAAEKLGLTSANFSRARLGRIKTLRLAGDFAGAAALVATSRDDERHGDMARRELDWEGLCVATQTDGDHARLRLATVRGAAHGEATYMLEAMLWLAATPATDQWRRLPKLRYLMRLPDVAPQRLGLLFKIALQIERCYEFESPLPVRLEQLWSLLTSAEKLVSVDKEMLAWAASARWLARSKSFVLASLALNEYETLSLRLTSGGARDVLGLASDLYTKDWYANAATAGDAEDAA